MTDDVTDLMNGWDDDTILAAADRIRKKRVQNHVADLDDVMSHWERTCDACPTQYDIWLKDGRYFYFRYRHGTWMIVPDSPAGEPVAMGQVDQMADGFLTHDEVWAILAEHLPR